MTITEGTVGQEALATLVREYGVAAVRRALPDGWEYRRMDTFHIFRLMAPGQRRPVAGVVCVLPRSEVGNTAGAVIGLALPHVTVLQPGEWQE